MSDQSLSIHTLIEADRRAASPDAAAVKVFRQYARGRQRGTLTAGQERILRGLLGNLFCDNVCKRILSELRNRLRLVRFEVPNAAVTRYLEQLWTLEHLDSLSAATHWAMLRDGNHAIALGWVDGRVQLARERWWNGSTGIFVSYDAADRVLYAVKDWHDDTAALRRTIWYADRIERYIADGEGWRMINLPSDDVRASATARPVPWVDARGDPLGVPVVHFANIQVPNDGKGDDATDEPDPHYGMSELDGGITGLQDEINDLQRDISAAARFAGYQMLYATGITNAVDDEGNPIPLRVEPGAFFTDENPQAQFGALPAGSLAELQRALEIKLQAVSRGANIPMHVISGDWPSGEALLRAEIPLIDKVETIGSSTGPAWASVAHKATKIANVFGATSLDEEALISSVFAPVARRDPLTISQIAAAQAEFVSERQTLRTLGYTPKEIDQIMLERAADREQAAARAAAFATPSPPAAASTSSATNGAGAEALPNAGS